ncbi:MAG: ATP phosphoribosyltransferase regulatory subunit [Candidatus Dormibacteria bacterium]
MRPPTLRSEGLAAGRPTGFADLLPGQAERRRELEQTILGGFAGWGYRLLETPAVELLSTVEAGMQPEAVRRLFKMADADGRMLALVGERTVPVARVVAGQLRSAPLPLRLCYLGSTFEGHPAPGRNRQGLQAGAELVGAPGPAADAEVVALAVEALNACGVQDFQVEVGHVGFFGGIMEGLGDEQRMLVMDALAGRDLVELEAALAQTDLRAAEQELLLRFPALRGGPQILEAAGRMVDNPVSAAALTELAEVHRLLQAHGAGERVNLDLGAVRDFDYYSGVIFEVFAPGLGIPLAAGGRYDGLLQHFGYPQPATGVVVFLDRVQSLLHGERPLTGAEAVLVGHTDDPAAAAAVAARLRRAGGVAILDLEPADAPALGERAAARGIGSALLCDGLAEVEVRP